MCVPKPPLLVLAEEGILAAELLELLLGVLLGLLARVCRSAC